MGFRGLFIFILLFLFFALTAAETSYASAFSFEDNFECNDSFPHHSFCTAVGFKPWSEVEKNEIKYLIDSLPVAKLENFFKVIHEKGTVKFHRVNHSSTWVPNNKERRVEFVRDHRQAAIWVNPVTKVVGFSNSFFNKEQVVDSYTGVDRKKFVILHELAHVFDLAWAYSSHKAFLDILNWSYREGAWSPLGHSALKIKTHFSEILKISKNESLQKAYAMDRRLGRSYGYPSLYSMLSVQESFAELLAYSVLDPSADEYLSLEILNYFEAILNHKTK